MMKIIRDIKGFPALKADWEGILKKNHSNNFYLGFDWFYYILHCSQNPPRELYVAVFQKNGNTIAILPCCIVHKKLRLFRLKSLEIIGNIYSAYKGCIVLKGMEEEVAEKFSAHLLETESEIWDILDFEYIDPADPFIIALRSAVQKKKLRTRQAVQFANLKVDLSQFADAETYFRSMGKNHRRNIVKRINKLNRNGDFDIIHIIEGSDRPAKIPAKIPGKIMDDFYRIYDESWKNKDIDPRFHAKLAEYLAGQKMLRLFLLGFRPGTDSENSPKKFSSYLSHIQDSSRFDDDFIPLAGLYYVKSGDTAYALKTAYREKYSDYSPGTVLWWFSIKYLLEVDKCRELDFQKGDEGYKFRFGGTVSGNYIRYQAANPASAYANLEILSEQSVIPVLKKVKYSDLGICISRYFVPGKNEAGRRRKK